MKPVRKIDDLFKDELQTYYTGATVDVFLNNQYVDEVTMIGWNAVVNSSPLYSYNQELFNDIAKGVFRVEGKMAINYKATGYMEYVLLRGEKQYKSANNANVSPVGWFNPESNTEYKMNQYGEVEFTRDRSIMDRVTFDRNLAAVNRDEIELVKQRMKEYIWHNRNDASKDEVMNPKSLRYALRDKFFDILVMYGNPNSDNYTMHSIVDVKILDVSQQIANDGTPIHEVYTFIARDLDQPMYNVKSDRAFQSTGFSRFTPNGAQFSEYLELHMQNYYIKGLYNPWLETTNLNALVISDRQTGQKVDAFFTVGYESSTITYPLKTVSLIPNTTPAIPFGDAIFFSDEVKDISMIDQLKTPQIPQINTQYDEAPLDGIIYQPKQKEDIDLRYYATPYRFDEPTSGHVIYHGTDINLAGPDALRNLIKDALSGVDPADAKVQPFSGYDFFALENSRSKSITSTGGEDLTLVYHENTFSGDVLNDTITIANQLDITPELLTRTNIQGSDIFRTQTDTTKFTPKLEGIEISGDVVPDFVAGTAILLNHLTDEETPIDLDGSLPQPILYAG